MVNSSATFPIFGASDSSQDFLARARVLAAEEHVSLPKYLAGMLKHALRGHDLSKVRFYQDGSGDTYYEPVLDKLYEETMAASAAGLSYRCKTAEEGLALLKKWKEEAVSEIKK
ncbi:MAG: hypothetical protein LBQ23_00405 [Puniceicoccales bacterium]|jgi:hypothetical protein|nr:hypothetical protein [Puniceicoccales bacterium]